MVQLGAVPAQAEAPVEDVEGGEAEREADEAGVVHRPPVRGRLG